MTLDQFNALTYDEAMKDLLRCCGARRWASHMAARRPFHTVDEAFALADKTWASCDRSDAAEAFRQQPRINELLGVRPKSLMDDLPRRLLAAHDAYEEQFGYHFVACPTGKTAEELLAQMQERMVNPPARELNVAALEQAQIMRIRLGKLLQEESKR